MEKYYCKKCKYTSEYLGNFKRHLISKCHKKNLINNGEEIEMDNLEKYKIKVYYCEECNEEFTNKTAKSRHKIKCKEKQTDFNVDLGDESSNKNYESKDLSRFDKLNTYNILNRSNLSEIDLLKADNRELLNVIKLLQNQVSNLSNVVQSNNIILEKSVSAVEKSASAMERSAAATEKTADVANKSMSLLKYVQLNFPNAPPLKKLNKKEAFSMLGYDNPNMSEEENEKYVKLVLANYENKNIAKFFGDLIVNYYEEDDVKDVRFWTSDVARLCFCVMQTIDKEGKTEWIKDKSGTKFTEMVINPMFNALNTIFNDFLNFKSEWEKKQKHIAIHQMDYLINSRQKSVELLKDIRYNKYTQPILKIVAPKYDFDTYKKKTNQ